MLGLVERPRARPDRVAHEADDGARLTLQHHKLTDVVTVDPRAAAVGESSIDLRSGEQITVRDLLKGALIQSANDAADALALSIAPDFPSFARLMNAKAAEARPARHALRPARRPRRARRVLERGATSRALARLVMHTRFVRETVREETATISGGRTLHTWDDLLGAVPADDRRQDGPHRPRRLVPGRRGARPRRDDLRDAARLAVPVGAQRRSRVAAGLGARAVPRSSPAVAPGARYADVQPARTAAPRWRSSPRSRCSPSPASGRPLTERVVAPVAVSLPVRQGDVLGRVEIRQGSRLVGDARPRRFAQH